jgi:hypothetical protein
MRWATEVEDIAEKRNKYRVLVRKPEARRPLGGLKSGWEDNIKVNLKEAGLKTGISGGSLKGNTFLLRKNAENFLTSS